MVRFLREVLYGSKGTTEGCDLAVLVCDNHFGKYLLKSRKLRTPVDGDLKVFGNVNVFDEG